MIIWGSFKLNPINIIESADKSTATRPKINFHHHGIFFFWPITVEMAINTISTTPMRESLYKCGFRRFR